MNKSVLIGTFVKKEKILTFLEYLKVKLNIDIKKIRIYNVKSNIFEYLVTFKTYNKEKYLSKIRYSTVMHVKNGCLFSINALNKLIEKENGEINKEYQLEWEKYKGMIIIQTNGQLVIEKLNKIEDKSTIL
jgi:hypothetical protein